MSSLYENFGVRLGKSVGKGQAIFQAVTGTEEESLESEAMLGGDIAKGILETLPLAKDQVCAASIADLGKELVSSLKENQHHYRFFLVENDEPNAFALPGGYIFIQSGLVKMCEYNEDELAFVLAHEIGHVVLRHSVERMLSSTIFNMAMRVMPGPQWIKKYGVNYFSSAFSRDNEFEADEFAYQLLTAVGINPHGGIDMFRRLRSSQSHDSKGLGSYFASHPPLVERINELHYLIS